MKIQVLSAMYGRHEAVSWALDSWYDEGLECVMIVSNSEDGEFCDKRGIEYIYAPNNPLAKKWQTGVNHLKVYSDADAFLMLGSDDMIKGSENYKTYLMQGYEFIGVGDMYVQDLKTGKRKHWKGYTNHRRGESAGAGRCLSRSLMEKMDWLLWSGNNNNGLDGVLSRRLSRVNHKSITLTSELIEITDLKDKDSLTPFHRFNLPIED